MHKKTCLTAGIMVATLGLPVAASAETLQEALASAYTYNPTLLAQRARVQSNDELVPQALSNWRPVIKLQGDAGRNNTSSNDQIPYSQVTSPRDGSVSIAQPLYRGGQTIAQTRQAEATVKSERALLLVTEEQVLFNVVSAYSNVVQDQSVVELNKNNEQVLQRQLDATRDRFRVGEVTRTDVSQAESRVSGAHADRIQAEGNLLAASANYLTVVGHAPVNLTAPGNVGELPANADLARAQALEQNPNVAYQQYLYEAATYGVDLATGALLPLITLNANYTKSIGGAKFAADFAGNVQETSIRTAQAMVSVTVPIYQAGAEYSAIRQRKNIAGQYRLTADEARREAVEAASTYWESLETAQARIVSYTDQIRAADIALEGVRRESQVGSRTVLDVLNAEQELLAAKVNLVQAQHDQVVADFQLKTAVGSLTAQSLGLPVEIYDPVKHYEEVRGQWIGTSVDPAYGEQAQ